jgi:hypothetical protein
MFTRIQVQTQLLAAALIVSACTGSAAYAESQQPQSKVNQCVQEISPDKKCQLIVMLIYDETCITSCTVVKPIVRELAEQNKIQYEELNTSPSQLKATLERAKQLKLESFVSDRTDEVPIVGIFTTKGKLLKEIPGRKTRDVYRTAIEKAWQKVAR